MKINLLMDKNLRIHLYYPENAGQNNILATEELIVFVPGLPQAPNHVIGELFTKRGKACAFIYYYGTWFSGGLFSPVSSRKTLEDSIALLLKREGFEAKDGSVLHFDFKKIAVVANSYGAQVVLTSCIDYNIFSNIDFVSPLLFVHQSENKFSHSTLQYILDKDLLFWRRGMSNVYRGIESINWDNYFKGKDEYSKLKKLYPKINIITDPDDRLVSSEAVKNFMDHYGSNIIHISGVGHNFFRLYEAYSKLS